MDIQSCFPQKTPLPPQWKALLAKAGLTPEADPAYTVLVWDGDALIATGSISILASMCAFCQMTCYIIGYISYLMLKKKEPNLERPFKVPFGSLGAWFSIIAYAALAVLALDMNALPYNLAFDAICILYYVFYVRKRPIPQESVDIEMLTLQTAAPTAEEKTKLDKEFKIWKIGAIGVFIVANLLFLTSYFI